MPHLSFDYSRGLGDLVEMDAFCAHMRDAMVAQKVFPLGGIRVRGHEADCQAIADGRQTYHFLDMVLRIGAGRDEATKEAAVAALYGAAREFLEPRIGALPFALSFELREIDPRFSAKAWNTVHAALGGSDKA